MSKESLRSPDPALRRQALKIDRLLAKAYPDAGCSLDFEDPLQCLVSTILSAQCTDKKVNTVTPALFRRYRNASAFANAKTPELERMIRTIGLFRSKAGYIIHACRQIVSDHAGVVPRTMDELLCLPGVGRKTANCVLLNAYGQPGIMCDTHFCRVTRRLGLHNLEDPDKIELAVGRLLPPVRWGDFSHRVIHHGRAICHARRPACERCPLCTVCNFGLAAASDGR